LQTVEEANMAGKITRILVPTDFSETADAALGYAKTLAAQLGASLHVVHVFADPYSTAVYAPEVYAPLPPEVRAAAMRDIQEWLEERFDAEERRRFRGTAEIVTGLAAKQIAKYAVDNQIDLIVMGTHGRRGVAHLLLGSVAEHVVRIARCPVLTIREARTYAAARPVAAGSDVGELVA
jgi:nucleotide-binding universal stress UspA family protein